jgi:hypothetical protein
MTNENCVKRIMRKAICFAVIASSICFFISTARASEGKKRESHTIEERPAIHLSHDLKVILNQEMNEIEQGMIKIIPAISAGNWEKITKIAKKIKNSFILKQKLTEKQIEELHHSLPTEFIEMDHSFHSTAGKLAHAALEHDDELVNFYFYKLHSQCLNCHSKYASERFPKLKKIQQNKGDHN